jgi:hypothetical protein
MVFFDIDLLTEKALWGIIASLPHCLIASSWNSQYRLSIKQERARLWLAKVIKL